MACSCTETKKVQEERPSSGGVRAWAGAPRLLGWSRSFGIVDWSGGLHCHLLLYYAISLFLRLQRTSYLPHLSYQGSTVPLAYFATDIPVPCSLTANHALRTTIYFGLHTCHRVYLCPAHTATLARLHSSLTLASTFRRLFSSVPSPTRAFALYSGRRTLPDANWNNYGEHSDTPHNTATCTYRRAWGCSLKQDYSEPAGGPVLSAHTFYLYRDTRFTTHTRTHYLPGAHAHLRRGPRYTCREHTPDCGTAHHTHTHTFAHATHATHTACRNSPTPHPHYPPPHPHPAPTPTRLHSLPSGWRDPSHRQAQVQ